MRILLALVVALVLAAVAGATAPPVVNVPAGPVSTIATQRGQLVSIALPHRAGRSWRLARNGNPSILRQVGEADVGANVVVVFRAAGKGKARVTYALTRGETARAFASRSYVVTIR